MKTLPCTLPRDLCSAYEWTDSAGELDELRDADGESLYLYCRASASNAVEHGHADVTEDALRDLHEWLVSRASPATLADIREALP